MDVSQRFVISQLPLRKERDSRAFLVGPAGTRLTEIKAGIPELRQSMYVDWIGGLAVSYLSSAKIAIAALIVGAGPALADSAGEQEYVVACAGCHGESGMGMGPFAELLNTETPNLVNLAKANGGVFPFETVLTTIDGRDGVRAHGSTMPIWGERFKSSASSRQGETTDMVARGRILSLVFYLQSIQE